MKVAVGEEHSGMRQWNVVLFFKKAPLRERTEMLFVESEIIDLGNTNQRMKEIGEEMRDIMGKGETLFIAVRMNCGFRMCCPAESLKGLLSMLSLVEKIICSICHLCKSSLLFHFGATQT